MNDLTPIPKNRNRLLSWQVLKEGWQTLAHLERYTLHRLLCSAYDLALELTNNTKMWREFRDDPGWDDKKKPRKDGQAEALRWVLSYSVANQKTASFYHRALAPFAKRQAASFELAEALEERGLRKLAAPAAKSKKLVAQVKDKPTTPRAKPPLATPSGTTTLMVYLVLKDTDFDRIKARKMPLHRAKLTVTLDQLKEPRMMTVEKLKGIRAA